MCLDSCHIDSPPSEIAQYRICVRRREILIATPRGAVVGIDFDQHAPMLVGVKQLSNPLELVGIGRLKYHFPRSETGSWQCNVPAAISAHSAH
jgi:hypothetical protein